MSIPLLQTKLCAPPLPSNLIRRPWLTAKLSAGGLRPLTLIAAPAGFGKTTLVSEWIHGLQNQPENGADSMNLPIAWFALEEDDNDPSRFFTYFLGSLRMIAAPELGKTLLALLQSPQPPPLRPVLNTLAHELIRGLPPCVLVLDDYHVINSQPIHDTVLFLLEHVPALHWVITTRADPPLPLGRLRARQQLVELRASDLRFDEVESSQLLNGVMQLALPPNSVQELQAKTEGWIAGLQLAGLALQANTDRAAFTQDFLGSHRYVADYLADEVLNRLPDQTQHFLLQTAILDRLCAELCDALIGTSQPDDSQTATLSSQLLLEELEHANLFLIPLDSNRRWYRYHQLFADLLRQRLQQRHPQLAAELHRRAATWFAQNGLVDDAIRHALAGQDFTQAADLLEQSSESLWMQGRFATLRSWLALLPARIIQQRPRLVLALAWTHVLTDAPTATITALLANAEDAILQAGASEHGEHSAELHGVLAAIRAIYHSKQEDADGVIVAAEQALANLPSSMGHWRSVALMALGFAYAMTGAARTAQEKLTTAIQLCQQIGNRYSALVATMSLARTHLVQGQLRLAASIYTQGLTQAIQQGLAQLPVAAQAQINLGRLNYEWNELASAAEQLQQGVQQLEGQGGSWLEFDGYILLARVRHAQGQPAAALAALHQADQIAQALPFQWTRVATAAALVRARLALGDATGATAWLVQAKPTVADDLPRVREGDHFTAVRVLIAQGRATEALPLLAHLGGVAEAAGRMNAVVESSMLTALAYYQQGDHASAQAAIRRALTLAEPEGYIRMFADEGEPLRELLIALRSTLHERPLQTYVDQLLAAFDEQPAPSRLHHPQTINLPAEQIQNPKSGALPGPQNLIEPLSGRELELLQLMAAGLSNQEIANQLFITLGTVKSHANHIYGKLGVQGRVKAINRARELALI